MWQRWFTVKGRSLFSIAFSLHRLTGIVLTIYLCMHLAYLTSIRMGKEVFESFIATTVTPQFLIFDILLILAGVYHGVNGLRLIIHEFGLAYESRKSILYISVAIALIVWLIASYRMYIFVMGV